MPEETKLAIYFAEREEKSFQDSMKPTHHAFLLLIDESTEPVSILQQLHFNDCQDGRTGEYYLLPNVRKGTSLERILSEVRALPLISGNESTILDMWNNTLKEAIYQKAFKHKFSLDYDTNPEAINCRAGLLHVLKGLGIDLGKDAFSAEGGTACKSLELFVPYDPKQNLDKSLFELWKTNTNLRGALSAHWVSENRHTGPIKQRFIPIEPSADLWEHSFEQN